jgi:hypothetical protein
MERAEISIPRPGDVDPRTIVEPQGPTFHKDQATEVLDVPHAEGGVREPDVLAAFLSDVPAEPEADSQLVEDEDEARAMADAGNTHRYTAAGLRAQARKWENSVLTSEDQERAERYDSTAEKLEEWAQALYRHPELEGKAFDGEPITPQMLIETEQAVQASEQDLRRLEGSAKYIAESPYPHNMDALRRYWEKFNVDPTPIWNELGELAAKDDTTIGQLREVEMKLVNQFVQATSSQLRPRRALLDAVLSKPENAQ